MMYIQFQVSTVLMRDHTKEFEFHFIGDMIEVCFQDELHFSMLHSEYMIYTCPIKGWM